MIGVFGSSEITSHLTLRQHLVKHARTASTSMNPHLAVRCCKSGASFGVEIALGTTTRFLYSCTAGALLFIPLRRDTPFVRPDQAWKKEKYREQSCAKVSSYEKEMEKICRSEFAVGGFIEGERALSVVRLLCTIATASIISAWYGRPKVGRLSFFLSHWLRWVRSFLLYRWLGLRTASYGSMDRGREHSIERAISLADSLRPTQTT